MTTSECLRALLDKRGVEYKHRDMFGKHVFHWGTPAVNGAMFTDGGEWTELVVENPTPEQAIEVTLGRGTCKVVSKPCDMWECECGKTWWHGGAPNYCPSCGRRVVVS